MLPKPLDLVDGKVGNKLPMMYPVSRKIDDNREKWKNINRNEENGAGGGNDNKHCGAMTEGIGSFFFPYYFSAVFIKESYPDVAAHQTLFFKL